MRRGASSQLDRFAKRQCLAVAKGLLPGPISKRHPIRASPCSPSDGVRQTSHCRSVAFQQGELTATGQDGHAPRNDGASVTRAGAADLPQPAQRLDEPILARRSLWFPSLFASASCARCFFRLALLGRSCSVRRARKLVTRLTGEKKEAGEKKQTHRRFSLGPSLKRHCLVYDSMLPTYAHRSPYCYEFLFPQV